MKKILLLLIVIASSGCVTAADSPVPGPVTPVAATTPADGKSAVATEKELKAQVETLKGQVQYQEQRIQILQLQRDNLAKELLTAQENVALLSGRK